MSEARKDEKLSMLNSMNAQRSDAKVSNAIQGQSFKMRQDNDQLKADLLKQIQEKKAQTDLERRSKLEQERIGNERDDIMRKQHAIMQAQRRHL